MRSTNVDNLFFGEVITLHGVPKTITLYLTPKFLVSYGGHCEGDSTHPYSPIVHATQQRKVIKRILGNIIKCLASDKPNQ